MVQVVLDWTKCVQTEIFGVEKFKIKHKGTQFFSGGQIVFEDYFTIDQDNPRKINIFLEDKLSN